MNFYQYNIFFCVHGEAVLSERSCREWIQKFKNGEFDIEDKELSGRPKVYEDAELEALLDWDSCQTQEEQYYLNLNSRKHFISTKIKSKILAERCRAERSLCHVFWHIGGV